MKKSIIMIGISGLLSTGFAENIVANEIENQTTVVNTSPVTKHLSQRYNVLKNKKLAWTKRKKVLIRKFKELYDNADFLGSENHYGKLRLEKHQKQFYTSLKEKDDEIETKLIDISKELKKAKRRHPYLTQRL